MPNNSKKETFETSWPLQRFFNTQCISLTTSGLWLPVAKLRAATLLFLLHKKLKLDEILKTLQGVKEDPLGTPKHQRTKYFTRRILKFWPISIFPPGFKPGTSRTLSKTSTPRPRRLEIHWQKTSLFIVLAKQNWFVISEAQEKWFSISTRGPGFKSQWK